MNVVIQRQLFRDFSIQIHVILEFKVRPSSPETLTAALMDIRKPMSTYRPDLQAITYRLPDTSTADPARSAAQLLNNESIGFWDRTWSSEARSRPPNMASLSQPTVSIRPARNTCGVTLPVLPPAVIMRQRKCLAAIHMTGMQLALRRRYRHSMSGLLRWRTSTQLLCRQPRALVAARRLIFNRIGRAGFDAGRPT